MGADAQAMKRTSKLSPLVAVVVMALAFAACTETTGPCDKPCAGRILQFTQVGSAHFLDTVACPYTVCVAGDTCRQATHVAPR